MNTLVAVLDKEGKNATQTALTMLKAVTTKKAETYGIATSTKAETKKTLGALQNLNIKSHIIVAYVCSLPLDRDEAQPIRLEKATMVLDGKTFSREENILTAESFEGKTQNHQEDAKTIVKETEGDFAFVIAESERIIAGRDSVGLRPLYYGENIDIAALASERKALWEIGIENAVSFPPGHVAILERKGFKFAPVKRLAYSEPEQTTMKTAAEELLRLLQQSVKSRVFDQKEVAIAFSGGLDSSLIASLVKDSGTKVSLIHVSMPGQPETEHAKRVADELRLPIHVCQFTEEDVRRILPRVLWTIEEADAIGTSIAIPMHWAAEKTADMGLRVMLAGQGADELFGGYKRYVDCCVLHGEEKARRSIFNDIVRLHETNLERDFKICSIHGVELRLPFADYGVARFALSLPLCLKIDPNVDTLRKLVLRQVARNVGLSQSVTEKAKKAVQYTTGTNNALKRIAKRNGLTINEYLQTLLCSTRKKMIQHEQDSSDLLA
jgi:asparagine synthase (glutamine-hydrolysing)